MGAEHKLHLQLFVIGFCLFFSIFGCGRTKLGHLYDLIYITELLLVWPVGNMNPYITDWVTKSSPVPREFELVTYQSECDALTYRTILNAHKKI